MYQKILTVIFLMFVLEPGSVFAEGISGFDQLQWKMTKSKVKELYPNFEEWVEDEPPDPVVGAITGKYERTTNHMFGLKEYYVLSCAMKLNLEFVNNELESISLTHYEYKGSGCQSRLKENLTAKYGVPVKARPTENSDSSESLAWKKKDLDIHLTTIYYSPKAKIFLHYSNPGMYEQFLLDQIKGKL